MTNDPLQQFIDQLAQILQMVKGGDAEPKGKVPDNILEQLSKIEKEVEQFHKLNEKLFSDLGLTDQILKQTATSSEKDARILERFEAIKNDFNRLQQKTKMQAKRSQEASKSKKKKTISRKKRFRRMGGREDWKPL